MLLGESWRPAAELLRWMVGVVFFYSLFAVSKSYVMALRRTRLLIVARLAQWAALLAPLLPWVSGADVGVRDVALGLSLSYAAAFGITLALVVRYGSARPRG
jgi:O-antigen/teichoic acid export membrane protein